MKTKISKKGLFCMTATVCLSFFLTGCQSPPKFTLPLESLPSELTETFPTSLEDAVNVSSPGNAVPPEAENDPQSILSKKDIDVYFDNTTGCFRGYAILAEQDSNDSAYQIYRKTMKSFRNTFDMAEECTVKTLQTVSGNALAWCEDGKLFNNFGLLSSYTGGTGGTFAEDASPIGLWLSEMRETDLDEDNISVYISDLNEQNGLLSGAGKELHSLMESDPDKDVLIISYVLSYKGEISAPTIAIEGNIHNQVETRFFDRYVDRNYYLVAVGDHVSLSALANAVEQNFGEIGLPVRCFMYRDAFYHLDEVKSSTASGVTVEQDFLQITPPEISQFSDTSAPETAAAAPEGGGSIEDQLLGNASANNGQTQNSAKEQLLAPITDTAQIFRTAPTGQTFLFRNLASKSMRASDAQCEVTFHLENADLYQFDPQQAAVYIYALDGGGELMVNDTLGQNGWVLRDVSALSSIHVDTSSDTVTVKLDELLTTNGMPALAVSVPVIFSYTKETSSGEVSELPENFTELVNDCKVPDILSEAQQDEVFTKTYDFDSFMDKLTSYKSLGDSRIFVGDDSVAASEHYTLTADRLNIVIVADDGQ